MWGPRCPWEQWARCLSSFTSRRPAKTLPRDIASSNGACLENLVRQGSTVQHNYGSFGAGFRNVGLAGLRMARSVRMAKVVKRMLPLDILS